MKKLYIDYDRFLKLPSDTGIRCSYHMHPGNNGITGLREELAFMFACRRCEDHPCVNSCPTGALKREGGLIKRSRVICISCKTCSLACPFGTILPELIPYLVSRCDACMGRLKDGEEPLCVTTCSNGAIQYVDEDSIEDKTNLYTFGDNILVRVFNYLDIYGIKR
jgi:Fe-S-cluster-containing dehydrogenase component